MTAPVILVETSPRRAADGVAETVRMAGGGALVPFAYSAHNDWRAGISALPTLIASLEFQGGEFPPGSVPAAAEFEWGSNKAADLAALASYMWFDAPISVWIGAEGAALPPLALSGQVLEATAADGKLKISLADPATSLKKPLLTTRFLGTGTVEGPVEWTGLIRPRLWGRVWNVSGQPIDKANNIYMFGDPQRKLQDISAVRDKGAPAASLTTLAWAGSVAATFTALQAAAAPAGGGVICPSIGCVKWWTQPAGALCADIKGEIGAAYVETTAGIMKALVDAIGGPAFAAGTIAAADAARGAPVGWIANDDSTTVAAMLDELAGNSSIIWMLDSAGPIVLRTWTWGASVAAAKSHSVSRRRVLRPVATRKLGYQRNETRMQRGELAAIVLATDATYSDGTPVEALKPGEVGATTGDNLVFNSTMVSNTANKWWGTAARIAGVAASNEPAFFARSTASGGMGGSFNGGALIPVVPGEKIFVSGQVRDATQATNNVWWFNPYFYKSDGVTFISQIVVQMVANSATFAERRGSFFVPAGAAYMLLNDTGYVNTGASVDFAYPRFARTELQATLGAQAGVNLQNNAGSAYLGDSDIVTAVGTAAAIAGQAATATSSDFAAVTGATKPSNNADVTSASQVVAGIVTDQTIAADYTGTLTGTLSDLVWAPIVTKGGTSIKLDNLTTYALSGAANGTFAVDNTNGSGTKGNVTVSAMSANSAQVYLTVSYNSVQVGKFTLRLDKVLGAPPASGGTPGKTVTWVTGEYTGINTTSYTAIVALKTVALATGESLYGTGALDYHVSGTTAASRTMTFKWQYSVAGANSWSDFGSPTTGSSASSAVALTDTDAVNGTVAVTQTKSGLSAGNYDVRLVALDSATGRNCLASGTATVEAKT